MADDLKELKKKLGASNFNLAMKTIAPKGTRVVRPLPKGTSIADMGLPAAALAKLSPAAKNLTKDDLTKLWQNKTTPAAAKLSLTDLNVIKSSFAAQLSKSGAMAGDIYCCCCPCCCATAVVESRQEVA